MIRERRFDGVGYQGAIVFLRGVAAILVFFAHYRTVGDYGVGNSWMSVGAIGVDIFFIISGYLMCMLLDGKADFSGSKRFYFILSRVARIYPVMLMAMVMYFCIRGLYSGEGNFYSSLILLPSENKYYGGASVFFLEPQWSLGFEMGFYVLVGLLLSRVLVFIIILSFGFFSIFYKYNFYMSPIVFEFLFGFILFFLVKLDRGFNVLRGLLVVVLLVGFYFVYQSKELAGDIYSIKRVFLWGGVSFLFVFLVITYYPRWSFLQARFFSILGEISFSIYLVHMAVLIMVSPFVSAGLVGFITVLTSTILSSYIFYKLIERPLHIFSRRIKHLG